LLSFPIDLDGAKSKLTSTDRSTPTYLVVVLVLPDPFRGMGTRRNSTEAQQSDHAPRRSGSEVKNWRISSAKDGAPERRRCGTIQKEVIKILQMMSAGAARRILLQFYPE